MDHPFDKIVLQARKPRISAQSRARRAVQHPVCQSCPVPVSVSKLSSARGRNVSATVDAGVAVTLQPCTVCCQAWHGNSAKINAPANLILLRTCTSKHLEGCSKLCMILNFHTYVIGFYAQMLKPIPGTGVNHDH